MIGDWCILGNGQYAQIDTVLFKILLEYEIDEYENNLRPIPLTEEILEANGFIHHDYWNKGCYAYDAHKQDILWSMDFYFAPEKGRMEFGAAGKKATINDWHCEYVHQLQHALRLCGLTELADNFKIN